MRFVFMVYVTIPQLNAGTILALLSTGKMGNKSLPENRRVTIGGGGGGGYEGGGEQGV